MSPPLRGLTCSEPPLSKVHSVFLGGRRGGEGEGERGKGEGEGRRPPWHPLSRVGRAPWAPNSALQSAPLSLGSPHCSQLLLYQLPLGLLVISESVLNRLKRKRADRKRSVWRFGRRDWLRCAQADAGVARWGGFRFYKSHQRTSTCTRDKGKHGPPNTVPLRTRL